MRFIYVIVARRLNPANYLDIGKAGVFPWYGYGEGVIDELCFFDWALLDSEAYAEYVYSSNRHRYQPTAKPVSTGNVQVVNKSLLVPARSRSASVRIQRP